MSLHTMTDLLDSYAQTIKGRLEVLEHQLDTVVDAQRETIGDCSILESEYLRLEGEIEKVHSVLAAMKNN